MNSQLYTMIRQHLRTHPEQPVYIFDLDGTLSDGSHRLDKLPTKDLHLTESWLEFNRLSAFDSPIEQTISVMNGLYKSGAFVIILTGRADDVVEDTTDWLHDAGAKYNVMVMRHSSDNRKDTVIKEEFLRYIGLHRITAAWDDSPRVIEHFRSLGIMTYQVCDYGDKLHSGLQSHGVDNLNDCDHFWSQTIEDSQQTCVSCDLKKEADHCLHTWERHSIGDQYFNVCTQCGKQED